MPYTPPTQRSPANSKPNSPILSRNHSYSDITPLPAPVQRPALPRSTSYLNKQRRSPSISNPSNDAAANAAANTAANVQIVNGRGHSSSHISHSHGSSANGSLRQSPPPVSNFLMPSGAVTTPPDSSDDDDERGRNIGNLKELQEALQHIDLEKRPHSPNRDGAAHTPVNTLVSSPNPPTPTRSLSAEARKIAHSRSSSEMNLSTHNLTPLHAESFSSSEGSDVEDDELRIKPPLVRKKSGELVKPALRPTSRRRPSSMPGTPTYHKAVHFNEDMEQVRHFLQIDRPIAVSAGSSPVETYDSESEYPFAYDEGYQSGVPEWELKLTNFPSDSYERQTLPVRVERIFLTPDNKTLVGTVACANISFHKLVIARFTLDYWKTTSEVVAEFNHDVRKKQSSDGYDRFNFNIKLADQANLASKTLLLCVRYTVNGQDFWDNNNSMNYQVDFVRKTGKKDKKVKSHATGTLGAIPRSRHSPPAPRPRSMPAGSFDDDFGHGFDSKFEFGQSRGLFGDSPSSSIRLKPKNKRGSLFPDQASSRGGQAFSTRYDFSASLSAALSTAQSALGDRSGIKSTVEAKSQKSYFDKPAVSSKGPASVPAAFPSEKPDLQSAEYNELIQKFCFFGTPSAKGSPQATTPATRNPDTDGAAEYSSNNSSGSNQSSASNSPPSPVMPVLVDGANDSRSSSRSPTHFLSRSTSPGPVTGTGPEDHKASNYQYGFLANMPMFSESSHTAQACV